MLNKFRNEKYVQRLVNEWSKHKKIIIACDFDDTIFPWNMEIDHEVVVNQLMLARRVGAYIVIFTASDPSRYDEIRKYCKEIGLEIDAINRNPIPLPYGNSVKIYANIFIDDRAGLNEALQILEEATEIMKTKFNS